MPNNFMEGIPEDIQNSIREASRISGEREDFLHRVARKESNVQNIPTRIKGGTAGGLFQITDPTFKGLAAKYGKEHGFTAADKYNPRANAIAGALNLRDTRAELSRSLSRSASDVDTYGGHFLGPGGYSTIVRNVDKEAAGLLPKAARMNRVAFYEGDRPRTGGELQGWISSQISDAGLGRRNVPKPITKTASRASIPVRRPTYKEAAEAPSRITLAPAAMPAPKRERSFGTWGSGNAYRISED